MSDDAEVFRPLLIAVAYKMTGSRADAEDIVQETLVRWLKADRSNVRSPKAFLTKIATRLSLNHLRARRSRSEEYRGDWLPEPIDTGETAPADYLEDISFGFLMLLERLTPLQRAVFVLRTAFDCDYRLIAAIVDREEVACRKTFSRARAAMRVGRARPVEPDVHRDLLEKFILAVEAQDLKGLAALLAEGAVLRGDGGIDGPALRKPIHGRATVARFVLASLALLPAGANVSTRILNGSPAVVVSVAGRAALVVLIECADGRIAQVFAVADPEKLRGPSLGSTSRAGRRAALVPGMAAR